MPQDPELKKRQTRNIVLLIVVFLASMTAIEILVQQLNNPVPIVNNLLVFTLVNINIILKTNRNYSVFIWLRINK